MARLQIVLTILAFVALVNGGVIKKPSNEKLHYIHLQFRDGYYGTIALGSNNQIFRVVFETTLSESWVPSSKCNKTNIACQQHNQYDALASITSTVTDKKFDIGVEPTGHIAGNFVYDYLVLSDFVIPNFEFAEVVIEPLSFDTVIFDGFVGLAHQYGANSSDRSSIMDLLLLQGLVDDSHIGIYYSKNLHEGGEIIFGGYNADHINSSINFLNSSLYSWSVETDSVSFGLQDLTPANAYFSSGSLVVSGPYEDVAKIHERINAVKRQDGIYLVNCDKVSHFPTLTFEFDGVFYSLKPEDYIVKRAYEFNVVCESVLEGSPAGVWVLGVPFFRNYYTIFDYQYNQIGLAESK